MVMIRLLMALYPAKWRAEFGDEFAALLEDTRLTPRTVADVVSGAGRLHVAGHRRLTLVLATLVWSGCMELLSVRAQLTANILWAPSNPERALALAATVGPWLALGAVALARHRGGSGGKRHPVAGGSPS